MKRNILKLTSVISLLLFSILGLLFRPQELHNINMIVITIVLAIIIHTLLNKDKKKNFKIFLYGGISLLFSIIGIITKYGYNRVYTSPFTLEIEKNKSSESSKENLKNESEKTFQVNFKDTIKLGNNYGQITGYLNRKKDTLSLLTVIIKNEYDNGIIRADTFSDGTLSPSFEFYINSIKKKELKLEVLEEFVYSLNDTTVRIDKQSNYITIPIKIEQK